MQDIVLVEESKQVFSNMFFDYFDRIGIIEIGL